MKLLSKLEYRYCLSDNDKAIIKSYNGSKPLSKNAEKTLTILSEVFGGLHHLDYDQLEAFDYQSDFYNQYLMYGSLATFDRMDLTCLVVICHDMAVRLEIQPTKLDPDDPFDKKLIDKQLSDLREEYGYKTTLEEFINETRPYLRLLFHQRKRKGDYSKRHPTLEDSTEGFRKGIKRFA